MFKDFSFIVVNDGSNVNGIQVSRVAIRSPLVHSPQGPCNKHKQRKQHLR